jgi:hypothetical protein
MSRLLVGGRAKAIHLGDITAPSRDDTIFIGGMDRHKD